MGKSPAKQRSHRYCDFGRDHRASEEESMSTRNGRGKRADSYDYSKMPDPIPDSPENIMRALCKTPPKKDHEWKYMETEKQPNE